jgi:membrane-associated sensor protein
MVGNTAANIPSALVNTRRRRNFTYSIWNVGAVRQHNCSTICRVCSVISITNLITSILLFAHFSIYRSVALLALASGYLFTAIIVIANALTIPDVFAPTVIQDAGLQTAPWLFSLWHAAFNAALLIYAWLKDEKHAQRVMNASVGFSIGTTVAITSGLACGMILFAILGHDLLPPLLQGKGSYTQLTPYVLTAGLVWCAIAVGVLWARRHSVLDYWLLIVALSLMSEVAFSLLVGDVAVSALMLTVYLHW